MFICNDCNALFEQPDYFSQHSIDEKTVKYFNIPICPFCGNEDIKIFEKS